MQPQLDVMIPHFRDPDGLSVSVASVVAQDWGGDIRVIVVDDGSPPDDRDRARAICETAALPVRFVVQPENLGRPLTRNRLLREASAPYLAWLDAGDTWYPAKLSIQFACLAEHLRAGADLSRLWVTCSYDWDQHGRRRPVQQFVQGDQFRELLQGNVLRAYLWTLLGHASAFRTAGLFDTRLPRLQDLDYFLAFVSNGGRLVTPSTTDPLCRYVKSDIGRSAADVRASNYLILAKHAAAISHYGPSFRKYLSYRAEHLAARFARSNGQVALQAACLARAAVAAPGLSVKDLARRILR